MSAIASDVRFELYGSELSPFALKVALALTERGIFFRWNFQRKSHLRRVAQEIRVELVKRGWLRLVRVLVLPDVKLQHRSTKLVSEL